MKCGDKEWMHCRVEKMGCRGCHYDKFNDLEIANEFANLTYLYAGKIVFTSEQMKAYQKAVKSIMQRNEQLEKYYQCERNLLDSYIPKSRVEKKINELKKFKDEPIKYIDKENINEKVYGAIKSMDYTIAQRIIQCLEEILQSKGEK